MNEHQLKGKWLALRGAAKRKWAQLTDNDWKKADGDLDVLAGRIVELYGNAREDVARELDRLVAELNRLGAEASPRRPRSEASPASASRRARRGL